MQNVSGYFAWVAASKSTCILLHPKSCGNGGAACKHYPLTLPHVKKIKNWPFAGYCWSNQNQARQTNELIKTLKTSVKNISLVCDTLSKTLMKEKYLCSTFKLVAHTDFNLKVRKIIKFVLNVSPSWKEVKVYGLFWCIHIKISKRWC